MGNTFNFIFGTNSTGIKALFKGWTCTKDVCALSGTIWHCLAHKETGCRLLQGSSRIFIQSRAMLELLNIFLSYPIACTNYYSFHLVERAWRSLLVTFHVICVFLVSEPSNPQTTVGFADLKTQNDQLGVYQEYWFNPGSGRWICTNACRFSIGWFSLPGAHIVGNFIALASSICS